MDRSERHPNDPGPVGRQARADRGQDGQGARDTVERFTAAISGIADGIIEGIDRYQPAENAEEALHEGGRMVRAPTLEAQSQLDSPESRELREDARQGAERVRVKTDAGSARAREEFEMRKVRLVERVEHGQDRLQETMRQAEGQVKRAQDTIRDQAQNVRDKAEGVREASHRSRGATAKVLGHVRDAATASLRSVGIAAGGYAAAGVVGAITLVLLSIGSVVGFNLVLGSPWGYFLTAGIYALGAVLIAVGARMGQEKQKDKAAQEMEDARDEITYVVAPLRSDGDQGHEGGRSGPHGTRARTPTKSHRTVSPPQPAR